MIHVEGQVVCLGSRKSEGVVDAEELVEEAGAFAALDVAAAAAGVVVGVERHWWKKTGGFRRRIGRRVWPLGYFLEFWLRNGKKSETLSLIWSSCLQFGIQAVFQKSC